MSFRSIVHGLVEHNVRFVVVGGVAAAAQGSSIVTLDLDICYATTDENVAALAKLLSKWKAYPRGVETGLPFIMDARTLRSAPVLTLDTTEGPLDVLDEIAGVGNYSRVRGSSISVSAFDTRFRVLTLEALISAKRAAGRPKDRQQLPELEALLELQKGTRR